MDESVNVDSTPMAASPEAPNVELEEENPEQDGEKYDNVLSAEDLIDLMEGSNEEASEDMAANPRLSQSASTESTAIVDRKIKKMPTSSVKSSKKQILQPKAKKRSIISVSSKASKISKVSKRSTASKAGKHSTSTKQKKVKKATSRSSQSSRYSGNSIFSRTSSVRSSRISRSSRVSLNLSAEAQIYELGFAGFLKSKKSLHPHIMNIETKEKEEDILHSDPSERESTDISEIFSEREVEDKSITLRYKMLEMLKDLPDINDISETSLHSPPIKQIPDEEGFVEPVSLFDETPETESVELQAKKNEDGMASVELSSRTGTSLYGSDDILIDLPSFPASELDLFSLQTDGRMSYSKDIATRFTEVRIRSSQVDFKEIEALEQRNIIRVITSQFVDELIGRVVNKCEEETAKLRRFLDKEKLWKTLASLLEELNDETLIRDKLEKLTTEHFLRKKRIIYIKPAKSFDEINFKRFRRALIEYDKHLEIEEKTNQKIQVQMEDLQKELRDQQNYNEEIQNNFEKIVRQTLLLNDSFSHLQNMVENVMQNMSEVHNEVSEMRLELLYTQHRFADLISVSKNLEICKGILSRIFIYFFKRSEALEHLSYGLRMGEYLSRQADTQVLSLKIEGLPYHFLINLITNSSFL